MVEALFAPLALWFTTPALLGSTVCCLVVGSRLAGGSRAREQDVPALAALSTRGLCVFLAGFGWAGLGALAGMGWEPAPAAAVGVVGGVTAVWLVSGLLEILSDRPSPRDPHQQPD